MVHGDGFIKFYNCFMENGKYKLTPREWKFYSLIAIRWSPFTNLCETTISTISNAQNIFKDKSRPTRDKSNTWEQIKLLEDKGLIQLLDEDYKSKKKFDYDKSIRISFVDLGDGFEKIHPDVYYLTDDHIELYFLCVLQRFKKSGYSHTYEGLADLLSCGESTAQTTVKNLKNKNMISYEQGAKFRLESGQWSRKANTYYLNTTIDTPVTEEKLDEKKFIVEPVGKSDEYVTIFGEITLKELLRKKEHSNWGKKIIKNGKEVGAKITESDIDLLLTLEDLEIEETFYKKYKGIVNSWIKNNDMDTSDIEKWIKNYPDKMKSKKDKWEEKKKEESIINGIVSNGETIILDESNIDSVDFNATDQIYYFDEGILRKGQFIYLAGTEQVTDKKLKDAIEEYKKVVKENKKLDIDTIKKIREKINS